MKKLTSIDYLTNDQMQFVNIKLIKQLKDCAIHVSQRKCKNAVAQMFCIKSKFVADCLLSWFNKKLKSQNLKLSLLKTIAFETKNPYQLRQQ